jgi:phosphoribosylcarboxyaminoimidazole (NCAIR) mutase
LNRGDNAALAAIEILNFEGQYADKLNDYRNQWKAKIKK